MPFRAGAEIDDALERVRAARADAMLVYPDGVTLVHRAKIAEFAMAQRLPSMFGWREYCEAGGLASYGANQPLTPTASSKARSRLTYQWSSRRNSS